MTITKTHLICVPAEEGYVPPLPSWKEVCSECGITVWRAYPLPKDVIILCLKCGVNMMENTPDITIAEPTIQQLNAIRDSKMFNSN